MALYDAFICYSHAKDKPVAAALQSVVQRLGKPWYRIRALRVFRDDTSLPAMPDLWATLEQALAQSRYLILLASPEVAASPRINREVAYWLEHNSADRLLIAATEGALTWDAAARDFIWDEATPLPPALKGKFAAEPKWVDLSAYRGRADKRDAGFIELAAGFAAAIRGMPKEDLLSEEVRQQRRALRLAWSAAAMLLLLAGAAEWQWKIAMDNERAAVEQRNRAMAAEKIQRDLAMRNFGIARDAADLVVLRIAQDLRDAQGMRVESVRSILDVAQATMDELAKMAPDDLQLQRSRSAMLTQFATTYLRVGELARAQAAAEEALAVTRKLTAADPANTEGQANLVAALEMVSSASDPSWARAALREAIAIVDVLAREGKLTASQRDWPQRLRDELAKLPPAANEAR